MMTPTGNERSRAHSRSAAIILASDVREGLKAVRRNVPLAALISDVKMPDGSGVEVVRLALQLQPDLRAAVVTAYNDPKLNDEVVGLGAEYLQKPCSFLGFALRLAAAQHISDDSLGRHVATFAVAHDLTVMETEVLALSVQYFDRPAIADVLGVSLSTIKSHAEKISKRANKKALGEIAHDIRCAVRTERERRGGPRRELGRD